MYCKWSVAPSGYCIGVAEINNKHYYCYGRNADHLEKNLKQRLYQKEGVSQTQVHLEQSMSTEIDLRWATKIFLAKFVRRRPNRDPVFVDKKIIAAPVEITKEPEGISVDSEYVCEEKDGFMIIYKLEEIKRYKLHNKGVNNANC